MNVGEAIEQELTPFLGPNTARNAVRTFAARAVRRRPEELSAQDAPQVVAALRPMLQTLLGREAAGVVTDLLLRRVNA